jgi:L-alanine-DL-glutamate epimerase-like enolase superfamily enzyme
MLPIGSGIRNAYIDFSHMTISLVGVVTDVIRDSRTVIGYGCNSDVRDGQGGLVRDRFAPRSLEAANHSLVNDAGDNFDPNRVRACMMSNEKPGGHGERSVPVGTLDMAIWGAVAKIADRPLFEILAERHGVVPDFVYAAGGLLLSGQGPSPVVH